MVRYKIYLCYQLTLQYSTAYNLAIHSCVRYENKHCFDSIKPTFTLTDKNPGFLTQNTSYRITTHQRFLSFSSECVNRQTDNISRNMFESFCSRLAESGFSGTITIECQSEEYYWGELRSQKLRLLLAVSMGTSY